MNILFARFLAVQLARSAYGRDPARVVIVPKGTENYTSRQLVKTGDLGSQLRDHFAGLPGQRKKALAVAEVPIVAFGPEETVALACHVTSYGVIRMGYGQATDVLVIARD